MNTDVKQIIRKRLAQELMIGSAFRQYFIKREPLTDQHLMALFEEILRLQETNRYLRKWRREVQKVVSTL